MTNNRHAADRLHDVRAEIKTLKAEADELRTHLLEHLEDLEGDEYRASVSSYWRRQIDWEGLERAVGKETLQRFTSESRIAVVRLCARERDAA